MTSATKWSCEACGGSGTVEHDEHAGVMEVVSQLRDSHQEAYPNCNEGLAKVRVETHQGTEASR